MIIRLEYRIDYYSIRFENVLIEPFKHNDIEVNWAEKYWTINFF